MPAANHHPWTSRRTAPRASRRRRGSIARRCTKIQRREPCHRFRKNLYFASDALRERAGKSRISTAARQKINHRAAWQKLELLLAANFSRSDGFCTLTYDEEHLPGTVEEAAAYMRRFLRRLRTACRRAGRELRYIYVTESMGDAPGEPGRLHHHIIANGGPDVWPLINALWRAGQVHIEPLLEGQNDGYEARARYMVKERKPGTPGRRTGARAWTPSKNLTSPK